MRLRVQPGGNVGIGTASPAHTLEVNGDLFVSGALTAQLAPDLVGTAQLVDGSVSAARLAPNAIGAAQLAPGVSSRLVTGLTAVLVQAVQELIGRIDTPDRRVGDLKARPAQA